MKIIHTSDWHLGHIFYGYDREQEQTAVMETLRRIIENEQPDALIISGDIYHSSQPPAWAQRLFASTIAAMKKSAPDMAVIATAGNHDSPSRHEIFRDVWLELGVHTIGTTGIAGSSDFFDKLIIDLPQLFVAAVPFVHRRILQDGIFKMLADEISRRNTNNRPVIAMAHTAVQSCNFKGQENDGEIIVGGEELLPLEIFGNGWDYIALGHIHHPQSIYGSANKICYSGSILPVSFDEDFDHSVAIVEIDAHGCKPHIRRVTIPSPIKVLSLPQQGFASWDIALQELRKLESDKPCYVRLNVINDNTVPADADSIAAEIAKEKKLLFCSINHPPVEHTKLSAKNGHMSIEEFKTMSPLEVAKLHAEINGIDFGEIEDMFNEVLDSFKNTDDGQ